MGNDNPRPDPPSPRSPRGSRWPHWLPNNHTECESNMVCMWMNFRWVYKPRAAIHQHRGVPKLSQTDLGVNFDIMCIPLPHTQQKIANVGGVPQPVPSARASFSSLTIFYMRYLDGFGDECDANKAVRYTHRRQENVWGIFKWEVRCTQELFQTGCFSRFWSRLILSYFERCFRIGTTWMNAFNDTCVSFTVRQKWGEDSRRMPAGDITSRQRIH